MPTLKDVIEFLRGCGMLDEARATKLNPLPDVDIAGFSPISATQPKTLSWMRDQPLDWAKIEAAAVICSDQFAIPKKTSIVFLPVSNPRLAFTRVLREFARPERASCVDPTAIIGARCTMGDHVSIGAYAVIGDDVTIGDRTEIGHHCIIGDNSIIGSDCVIKSHAVIGEEGFGFENDEAGHPIHMPHIGRVVIGDHVQIGNFNTIVRASLGETRLGDHVKLDDHVHVAHNVTIGPDTIVTGGTVISGGVAIGRNVWLSPNCTIVQKVCIGDDAFVGIGAVVTRDVDPNMVVVGSPARAIKKRFETDEPAS